MAIVPSINDVKRSRRLEEDNAKIPKSVRRAIKGACILAPLPSAPEQDLLFTIDTSIYPSLDVNLV